MCAEPTNRHQAPQTQAEQEKRHYLELENLNEIPPWLTPCHLIAGLFQFIQSVILYILVSQLETKWFIYTNYPGEENVRANEFGRPVPREIGAYSVVIYAPIFIMMSGIDHICMVLPGIRELNEYKIQHHESPFRWIEYSFSASLMRILIAQVAGVTDIHIIVCIFFLSFVSISFAFAHEKINAKARADGYPMDWSVFVSAFIPHMVTWFIIFSYYIAGVKRNHDQGFVAVTVISLFILDASFAILCSLQWAKIGIFRDYLVGEFGFIVLSFTSKTFLAWLTYAAAAR